MKSKSRKQVRALIREDNIERFNELKKKAESELGIKLSDSKFASMLISKSLT